MLSIKKLVIVFSTLLLALGVGNLLVLISAEQNAATKAQAVRHTHSVIHQAQKLLGQLRDAETGQRGYLLTEDTSYLAPYHTGVEYSWLHFNELKELTRNNPSQQQRLEKIRLLIKQKSAELKETINLTKAGFSIEAYTLVKSDHGKQLMDEIRTLLDEFVVEEKGLLEAREKDHQETQNQLYLFFILMGVVLIVTIALTSILTYRKVIRPILELTKKANLLSSGKYHEISIKSNNEIGVLVQTFNKMGQEIKNRTHQLELANENLKALSLADGLTHLANRRHFDQKLEEEYKRLKRSGSPLTLLMLDIDYFKAYNDFYGHLAGDECLKKIANVLKQSSQRPTDFAARYGGEEFALILSETDYPGAQAVAETIHTEIAQLSIANQGSRASQFVTISIGLITFYDLDLCDCPLCLIDQVDKLLYQAKADGRNRTVAQELG